MAAKHVMDLEVATCCTTGHEDLHAPRRANRRNGFRRLRWASNLGNIELRVPRLRHGHYTPSFLGVAIAPAQVEAVLHAADTAACEDALVDVLRSMGGPGMGRADAAAIVPGMMALPGKQALSVRDGQMAAQPLPGNGSISYSQDIWSDDEDVATDLPDAEDEEDPGLAGEIARSPLVPEPMAADDVLAMALFR